MDYGIKANYNGTRVGIAGCRDNWAVDGISRTPVPPEKENMSTAFSNGSIPRKLLPPENKGIITLFKKTYCRDKSLHEEEWRQEEEQYLQEAKALAKRAMR